jgi:hypothetical protein
VPEIRNGTYVPVADNHRVFHEGTVPVADLTLNTVYYSLPANFTGFSRQSFKVMIDDTGGGGSAQVTFMIQERHAGQWVDKKGLSPATVDVGEVCEHNSEDIMREARVCVTPITALPAVGIYIQISGKRDL